MEKKQFHDIEIKKRKFLLHKRPISISNIDITKIVEKCSPKIVPKMSAYRR